MLALYQPDRPVLQAGNRTIRPIFLCNCFITLLEDLCYWQRYRRPDAVRHRPENKHLRRSAAGQASQFPPARPGMEAQLSSAEVRVSGRRACGSRRPGSATRSGPPSRCRSRTSAGKPTPATTLPIAWSSAIWRTGSHESRNMGPARHVAGERHRGPAARPSPVRPGACFRVRDAAITQSAQFFTQTVPWLLASSGQEIRKTCGVAAYLPVVIEKHRTQASRTMNAEPAKAAADRVD